jgi:hypothetical protein
MKNIGSKFLIILISIISLNLCIQAISVGIYALLVMFILLIAVYFLWGCINEKYFVKNSNKST